jgi:hypothetical protein
MLTAKLQDTANTYFIKSTETTDRSCGSCSLCCKLLIIDDPELEKEANVWCQHCKPGKGGCAIYNQHCPSICETFLCDWMKGYLPDYWKPDKCKMVVSPSNHGDYPAIQVDSSFPGQWRKAPYYSDIMNLARGYGCITVIDGKKTFYYVNGEWKEVVTGTLRDLREWEKKQKEKA